MEWEQTDEIVAACLLAGKIMLQNGAETYRVEDTMMRIAASFGILNSQSFITPTGILFSLDEGKPAKFIRITERSTDLHKVTLVNNISRQVSSGELSIQEAYRQLQEIDSSRIAYPVFVQTAAAAVASGCFLIMFQGRWSDFIPAFLSGGWHAGSRAVCSRHQPDCCQGVQDTCHHFQCGRNYSVGTGRSGLRCHVKFCPE